MKPGVCLAHLSPSSTYGNIGGKQGGEEAESGGNERRGGKGRAEVGGPPKDAPGW